MNTTLGPVYGPPAHPTGNSVLMEKARDLETAFLTEMLAHAGMSSKSEGSFGGGVGEEHFASFLQEAQARLLVDRGGIGLAESLFRAMGGEDAGT